MNKFQIQDTNNGYRLSVTGYRRNANTENRTPNTEFQFGFTLMELMVVIAIIVMLAGIMTPNVARRLEKAKMTKAEADIAAIETAIAMYENDLGAYPPGGIDYLETCLTGRDDSTPAYVPADNPKWNGPYIKGIETDSWKEKYFYLKNKFPRDVSSQIDNDDVPAQHYGGVGVAPKNMSYYIYSTGKNKDTGDATKAADDINNWDATKSWQSEY